MSRELPPPYSGDTPIWAEDLNDYLGRARSTLGYLGDDDRAAADGIILWDSTGYPVVSKDGSFRQVVLADGHGSFARTSSLALIAGTETAIPWSASGALDGLSIDGNDIVFEESGTFLAAFSAQIYSTSSSTVNFAFWSRIYSGGSQANGNTMHASLHQNSAATVVSRTGLFSVSAGDKLRALVASDSSSGSLHAFPANQIATEPVSPAATLSVFRIHQ